MQRCIDLTTYRRSSPTHQQRRVGRPHFLRSKDLLKAFSGTEATLGQNDTGVYIAVGSLNKKRDVVTTLMFASEGDPRKIKNTVESIFLSEDPVQVELEPHELDLRQFADGVFSGSWHVFEEDGFSFAFLADAGYTIRLSKREALGIFAKILNVLTEER